MKPKKSQMSGGESKNCPDCGSEITSGNSLIPDHGMPEKYGHCENCYDPTPQHYDSSKSGVSDYERMRYGSER